MERWARIWLVLAALAVIPGFAADAAGNGIAFQQYRVGKAIVSLPSGWTSHAPDLPVWLHLHGAPAVLETNFAALGAPGILVSITLPGLSKVYADHFAEAGVFSELLRETEALLQRLDTNKTWRVGRLTVSSFSAGFGGVRQLLRQPAAFERIDALVMADSIYCGYKGELALRQIDDELMAGFLHFAREAQAGRKRFVISHSRQIPEGYGSTTETADYLIRQLQGERRSGEAGDWPGGLRLASEFSRGNCVVLGFEGAEPEDHMRHLRAIGTLWRRALE